MAFTYQHTRFTVDSKNNTYALAYGGYTPEIWCCPSGSDKFENITPYDMEVVSDILCDRINSHEVREQFKIAHGSVDCLWIMNRGQQVLSLFNPRSKEVVAVAGDSSLSATFGRSRDGYARIAPLEFRQNQDELAILHNSRSITRLRQPLLIITEGRNTLRLLNLSTWKVTTIKLAQNICTEPLLFPWPCNAIPSTLVASNDLVQVYDLVTHEVSRLDLKSGNVFLGGCDPQIPGYSDCLPIASSANVPSYVMFGTDGQTSIARFLNGDFQLHHLPERFVGAYVNNLLFNPKNTISSPSPWETFDKCLPPTDLSSLIDSTSMNGLLQITSEFRSWGVFPEILAQLHPSLDLQTLQTVIQSSLLPIDSITAFIECLHHKPLPASNWASDGTLWSHTIFLWEKVGIVPNLPLSTFISKIAPSLPEDDLCNLLINTWNDQQTCWTEHDPIIEILMSLVKRHCLPRFLELATSRLPSHYLQRVESFTDSPEFHVPDSSALAALGLRQKMLKWQITDIFAKFDRLMPQPFDFAFSMSLPHHQGEALVVDVRYLTQWHFFRRLTEVGGFEKNRRSAEMLPWMNRSMMEATLSAFFNTTAPVLGLEDSLELLDHRLEINLVDQNDVPIPPFGPLVEHCRNLIINLSNRE